MLKFIKVQTSILDNPMLMRMGYKKLGQYVISCLVLEGYFHEYGADLMMLKERLGHCYGGEDMNRLFMDKRLFTIGPYGAISPVRGDGLLLAPEPAPEAVHAHGSGSGPACRTDHAPEEENRKEEKLVKRALGFEI